VACPGEVCRGFLFGERAMNEMTYNNDEKNQRVVTFLNRESVDFLDKLGKDALFSTGQKVSRARLISWLVDFMKHLEINGENIKSEKDLELRVLEVLGQSYPAGHGASGHVLPVSLGGTKVLGGLTGGGK
jgi:hypothetical protein